MITVEARRPVDHYVLGRTDREYERLRAQSLAWEAATARLLDHLALAPGCRCLDAGCGPGETMRLMAEHVGPCGHVVGVDVDAALGRQAVAMLHDAGHRQCRFERVDLTAGDPIPGAPFDLVYARLLLYHLPKRLAVLRSLWDAVAPGGHLLVQDYEVGSISSQPALPSLELIGKVIIDAFTAAGCDVHIGTRLPDLFVRAGIGAPDGTDVAGRLEPLATTHRMLAAVYASILPAALARGTITEPQAATILANFTRDVERFPERPTLWPLLIGAWKRKPADAQLELVR